MKYDYLVCGDCLSSMDKLPNKSINLILCDLPFGVTKNDWDKVIPPKELWKQYKRIIKDNGAIILFGHGLFTANMMRSNQKMWRYNLVWRKTTKTGFLNAHRMPLRQHEDIMVFYKKLPTYNPQMETGCERKVSSVEHKRNCKKGTDYGDYELSGYDSTERFPTSILAFSTDKQIGAEHPTQKPLALCEYLIKTYTNEEDVVLDNCMGSGTTCLAAKNLNRHYIGMDSDEKWFEYACKRLDCDKNNCPVSR